MLQNVQNNLSIEDGTWKFIAPGKGPAYSRETNIEYGNLDKDQLYNLVEDRGEKENLAIRQPGQVARLSTRLVQIKAGKH